MAKVRIELNSQGIEALLKSQEMQNCLSTHANAIASRSGGKVENYVAPTRAVAEVSLAQNSKNMDDNTLLKALR